MGPRTAARFVFYLIKLPKEEIDELVKSILNLKEKVKLCSFCFKPFEPLTGSGQGNDLCEICSDPGRDRTLICVVEIETGLISLEKTKKYQGRYFILGGSVSKTKNVKHLRTNELLERVRNSEIQEIIIAINPTTEGEAITLYLERLLKPLNIKITRLGRGLPIGGELEYADEETISSALEGRK